MKTYRATFRTKVGNLRRTELCAYSPDSAQRILKMAFRGISIESVEEVHTLPNGILRQL